MTQVCVGNVWLNQSRSDQQKGCCRCAPVLSDHRTGLTRAEEPVHHICSGITVLTQACDGDVCLNPSRRNWCMLPSAACPPHRCKSVYTISLVQIGAPRPLSKPFSHCGSPLANKQVSADAPCFRWWGLTKTEERVNYIGHISSGSSARSESISHSLELPCDCLYAGKRFGFNSQNKWCFDASNKISCHEIHHKDDIEIVIIV